MSLIVRADDRGLGGGGGASAGGEPGTAGGLVAATAAVVAAPARTWVTFAPSPGGSDKDGERFRLEAVQVVQGPRGARPDDGLADLAPGFSAGTTIIRRQNAATRRPTGLAAPLLGVMDPRRSTQDTDAETLFRSWQGNPFRVALLLACVHGERLAQQKPDDRSFDHLGVPEVAEAARVQVLRRVVRHLHRATAAAGGWDTFCYFEMLPEHVAHLREYLAECREICRSARMVEREVEFWMVKHLDPPGSGPGDTSS